MKVLVLSIHGFHLGYIGCYGNEWIATPTLDALAATGVVFDQHFAHCPDVASAHLSWATGCYSFDWPTGLPRPAEFPRREPFPGFRDKEIHTVLITGGDVLGTVPGWDRIYRVKPDLGPTSILKQTMNIILKALDRVSSKPHWLVQVEIVTLLDPSAIPAEFSDAYEDDTEVETEATGTAEAESSEDLQPEEPSLSARQRSFAAAVTYVDAVLDRLLASLQERSWAREVVLVITSSGGQNIDEPRRGSPYQMRLHEELIHVPLIIRFPDGRGGGRRIAAMTQTVDMLPTLAALFDLETPEVQGRNLLSLVLGQATAVRDYACASLRSGTNVEWTLRSANWSYLLPMQDASTPPLLHPELYVKPEDRWEVNNVIQHHPELAGRLEKTLREFAIATAVSGPFIAPALQEVEEVEPPQPNS